MKSAILAIVSFVIMGMAQAGDFITEIPELEQMRIKVQLVMIAQKLEAGESLETIPKLPETTQRYVDMEILALQAYQQHVAKSIPKVPRYIPQEEVERALAALRAADAVEVKAPVTKAPEVKTPIVPATVTPAAKAVAKKAAEPTLGEKARNFFFFFGK